MFTGLVEAVGTLGARSARGPGARLLVRCELERLELGESIAVNGCCLTVDALAPGGFEADASAETLAKTTLGGLPIGARLNLERALTLQKRLGGHLVSGHVDGVGDLVSREPMGAAERIVFRAPTELMRFIAPKGSIAVDGTSLTVNEVSGETFSVAIIPRTNKETRMADVDPGGAVNLEIDLVARYVQRLISVPTV
ncbi:MAG TPA: riboflavin synthase [Polyangiaceae bacterium]|jgi:riboflavin synthase